MRRALLGVSVLSLLLLGAAPAAAAVLDVVASFTVLADVVEEIGGTQVSVTSLVGPNSDPHVFAPTPGDARALREADLVFVSGLGLEGWMDRLIAASGFPGTPVAVSGAIAAAQAGGAVDPHVWTDPANVAAWVPVIAAALSAADPAAAPMFAANAERYRGELAALDAEIRAALSQVPEPRRKVLTSHDALGWFGRAYGVTFLAPVGLSTEDQPSAAEVARLIDQIRREDVRVYFVESAADPRLAAQIAAATGAVAGGELYVEALSDEGGPASTYLAMMRIDLARLVAAMTR